jgi:hypothetical protein
VPALQASTVLLSENFDGAWSTTNPPAGWTIYFDGDTSFNDWHRAPDSGPNPWPDNPTPYALLDSAPEEWGTDSLISPSMDCSQYNVVFLRCSTYFRGAFQPYTAQLVGSVNGGPFQYLVHDYNGGSIGPTLQTFYLPWAANQSSVRLAWTFLGNSVLFSFWALDNVSVLGDSVSADVGCVGIVAPTDTLDSGAAVNPQVWVKNFRPTPADSFLVSMTIGSGYRQEIMAHNLPGGESTQVGLPGWIAAEPGSLTVTAWTTLFGDSDPSNDTAHGWCYVRLRDVGVTEILAPRDTVDSGSSIDPQATVHNFGNAVCSCYVFLTIGPWVDSVLLDDFNPGDDRTLTFASWPGNGSGFMTARCSTAWSLDHNGLNDTLSRTFFVRWPHFKDLAAGPILRPGSVVRESATVAPAGVISGSTIEPANFMAYFTICQGGPPVYQDSQSGVLQPGGMDTVTFATWVAAPAGDYADSLRVRVDGDRDPDNDTTSSSFHVVAGLHDVAVVAITSPPDTIYRGPVTPGAIVTNYGSSPETFTARFRITSGYSTVYDSTASVTDLNPDDSVQVAFPVWTAAVGSYLARCTLEIADADSSNNWMDKSFTVESLPTPFGWYPMKDVPLPPSGKQVKDGGWLAYDPGSQLAYCLKGNKTADFYVYFQTGDSWLARDSMPQGIEKKLPKAGSAGCSDGNGTIYATKGNNTLGFWKYSCTGDSWHQLKDVPLGYLKKKVKGGTSLCWAYSNGQPWVYMLKGFKNEFWRYDPAGDTWDSCAVAPVGSNVKWNKGSWIVYDGEHTIYAHKSKYAEFYAYNTDTDVWFDTLNGIPRPGSAGTKKTGDGSCAAWSDGTIMAFKGGNTRETWKYLVAGDTWIEQDTIPGGVNKKRVKAGAGMVCVGNGIFFATKGNKTMEFWRYRPAGGTGVREQYTTDAIMARPVAVAVRPNPFTRMVTIRFSSPLAVGASAGIYDVHGRLVARRAVNDGSNTLDLSTLSPGVYFLRLDRARITARIVKE